MKRHFPSGTCAKEVLWCWRSNRSGIATGCPSHPPLPLRRCPPRHHPLTRLLASRAQLVSDSLRFVPPSVVVDICTSMLCHNELICTTASEPQF
ncbi:hypothetical protein LZ32DRAFT_265070 [Colletotrichum eremochloae]|nr:hypothetical protein LZ32DRAFT_265070 [Colletotrichum eremochloae]